MQTDSSPVAHRTRARLGLQKFDELQALEAEHLETGPVAVELLDVGEGLFASAPDNVLRQIFQTFRLELCFDKPSHRGNRRVTIDDDSVAALGSNAEGQTVSPGWCTDVGSAPMTQFELP